MKNVLYSVYERDKVWDKLRSNEVPDFPEKCIEEVRKNNKSQNLRAEDNLNLFLDNCQNDVLNYQPLIKNKNLEEFKIYNETIVQPVKDALNRYLKDKKSLRLLYDWNNYQEFFKELPIENKYKVAISTAIDNCMESFVKGEFNGWTFYSIWEALNETDSNNELGYLDWLADNISLFNVEDKTLQGLAKFSHCYKSTRKYNKLTSTYVDGILTENASYCYEYDENGVSTGRWGEGTAWKVFPRYMVCQKKSKRWASSFHTIPKENEVRRCIISPPGYLLSYFDISGMEVRTLAYLSGDEFLINSYENGLDPYIELSKTINPDKPDSFHKEYRSDYKTTLLGSLYGMGSETMGGRIGRSTEESEQILSDMFTHMKGVKKFIEVQGEYPFQHNRQVKTILGDKLIISDDESEDRWARLGNNLCIQGGSAVLMATAFENIIQDSYDNPNGPIVRPMNVVHDSAQNYFQSKYIFDIHQYYYKRMTEYLYELIGIRYEFDTLVGINYHDMAGLKVIDNDTTQLTGSYKTLTSICKKLKEDKVKFKILSIKHKKDDIEYYVDGKLSPEFKPKKWDSFTRMYYHGSMNPVYEHDISKYRLIITRKGEL
jgi:hypothetical protein